MITEIVTYYNQCDQRVALQSKYFPMLLLPCTIYIVYNLTLPQLPALRLRLHMSSTPLLCSDTHASSHIC